MDKVVAAPIRLQFCNTMETSINIDDFVGWMSSGNGGGRQASSPDNPQQGEFVTKSVCSKIIRIRAPLEANGEGGEDYSIDLGINLYNDVSFGVQRWAKVDAPGCVNAAGKLGQK